MPPAGPLTGDEIALIARWIDEGATVPAETEPASTHWAFVPPKQVTVPAGVHPVDHLLAAERAKRGVVAAAEADPGTLARRLHLDLTGLPPTPAEVERAIDLRVNAALRDVTAFMRTRDVDMRTAAYALALGRLHEAAVMRGVYP